MSKTKQAAPATIAAAQAEEIVAQYQVVAVGRIRKSPDNRKRFNELALTELAASIKDMGIAQPILVRPVTPTAEQPEDLEIVAGERRWRAATIAGLTEVPVMIRELTDLQAAKIRILENLQREDPHPMEEADGYQQLMLQHGYSADQLADEIKKSRAYVYGRLKLCALTPDVREQFLDDKISASTALLIARIPVPSLQSSAVKEILEPTGWSKEPMSYRRAADHIQSRYTLDLDDAEFQLTDAKLLASAGACTKCPKRTGNQPEIYPDLSADVCTDPDCFQEKRAAHFAIIIVKANKSGVPVFEGQESSDVSRRMWDRDGEYVSSKSQPYKFARFNTSRDNYATAEKLLGKDGLPKAGAYLKAADGSLTAIYRREDMQRALEKAGICETEKQHADRLALGGAGGDDGDDDDDSSDDDERGSSTHQRSADAIEAEKRTNYRIALYKELRAHGATSGFCIDSLRALVKMLSREFSLPAKELADVYPFDALNQDEIEAHIERAEVPEIQLLLVDIFMSQALTVASWQIDDDEDDSDFGTMMEMVRHEGIDPIAVQERLRPMHIDLDAWREDDMVRFIKYHPYHIGLLKGEVLKHPDAMLVGMLERAATANGFKHTPSGFVKVDAIAAPNAVDPASVDLAAATQGDGEPVAVDGEDIAAAMAEPVKAPSKKAKKAVVLTPAAAWPFPKSSQAVLNNAAEPSAAVDTTQSAA